MTRVLITHQAVSRDAREDEKDILVQVEFIRKALVSMGHQAGILPVTLDLAAARSFIVAQSPDVVFNLVESIDGKDEFISFMPLILENLGMPFTGCGSRAFAMTSHKVLAKILMRNAGIPTPEWHVLDAEANIPLAPPYIIKHCTSHASQGINDDSVVMPGGKPGRFDRLDPWNYFAEGFVQGREFNISLLAGGKGVEVLPPAEIIFEDFPADKPRIVNYSAKWDPQAPEFSGTPRTFDFPQSDKRLLEKLEEISMECWKVFSLAGFARVDFRVDESGNPWVLEINANPCLSPDAGFFAACERSGLDPGKMAERIITDALRKNRKQGKIKG